jgi:ribonuclease HII
VAGVDEAGRGPLAGPVVAAACILPEGVEIEGVKDSKQLTPLQRQKVFDALIYRHAVPFGLGIVDAGRIDAVNILRATFEAMFLAVMTLPYRPGYVLVDGIHDPGLPVRCKPIIKGDTLVPAIMAASIIAKVTRDRIMESYDALWPRYAFAVHKGYGTPFHFSVLEQYGPSPIHRKSFYPIKKRGIHAQKHDGL